MPQIAFRTVWLTNRLWHAVFLVLVFKVQHPAAHFYLIRSEERSQLRNSQTLVPHNLVVHPRSRRRVPDNPKPVHASSSLTHITRTRATGSPYPGTHTRVLQPLPLSILPHFPPSILSVTPNFEPLSSHDQVTEMDFLTTTITFMSLPPNTLKANVHPVFQRFGEVKRIFVHPGGKRADVHGALYMRMPNNPSARLSGRSSRFRSTRIATRRAVTRVWDATSWASGYRAGS
jgi:hypothetical protein